MSLEILLIPVAIAAVAAIKEHRFDKTIKAYEAAHPDEALIDTNDNVQVIETRLKHKALLVEACRQLGANSHQTGETVIAQWDSVSIEFTQQANGTLKAGFIGTTDTTYAHDILSQIDARYGLIVQQQVLERIRNKAPESGLVLESEQRNDDDSVTMVLRVTQS